MIPQLNCLSPYYTQPCDLKHEKSKKAFPPPFIIVGRRKVSFNDRVDVFEVERLSETDNGSSWYSEHELSKFTRRYSKGLSTQNARSFNHTRRVLLHQNAYKQMGTKDHISLDGISRECSQGAKLRARKKAHAVSMEVDRWSWPTFAGPFGSGTNRGMADFSLNFFFDMFPKHSFCGSE